MDKGGGKESALKYRLDLEEVVTEILTGFIARRSEEVDPEIERALGDIGRFSGSDRAFILTFREGQTLMDCTHEWCAAGVEPRAPSLAAVPVENFPSVSSGIFQGRTVYMSSRASYTLGDSPEREELEARGSKSLLVVPMICGGAILGVLGLDSVRMEAAWPKEIVPLVRKAGEAFASSIKRKWDEEEQQKALGRLRDIIEFLPDATFVIDAEKKVIAWNRAIEEMTGIKKGEMLGQGDYAYSVPFFGERRPMLIDLLDLPASEVRPGYKYVSRAGGNMYAEAFLPRVFGGRGAHLWGVASPLYGRSGRKWGSIESLRDVSERIRMEGDLRKLNDDLENRVAERTWQLEREILERRQAEDDLKLSEQKYRELVQNANSIILKLDTEGRVTFFNEFAQEFFGYEEEEILGKSAIGTIVPEVETGGRDLAVMIAEIGKHPERFARNENENMRKSGERVWISWTNKPIFDPSSNLLGSLCVGNDITELITMDRELRRAKEAAEAADRLKSAFLATMSHELRTPLNSIIGFTGILLQGLPGPLNAEQEKQMGMIQHSARHLLDLITDVLDISKIESGQLDVASRPFDLRQSILKTISIVRPMAEKKGLPIGVDIDGSIGDFTGDPRRVEQVVLNLLNNAVKFTDHGGVSLAGRQDEKGVSISVSDTGIGIRQEHLEKIFIPFFQVDNGLTRVHEGTGLGLSISRKLAEKMGGSLFVESRHGYGSTFTLALPARRGERE